jgi:REP element-mobilizing transposase RayT
MARALRIEYEGAVYHVTARGNERSKIFFSKKDYARFKEYLGEAKEKYGFLLNAYVLMTNHYHLVVETPEKNLSRIMHYLNGSYTTYTNIKRKRSGHLFQGRYKAIVVDKDSYFLELSRYLHLNPVRAKMVQKPEEYPYSSYTSLITGKPESIVDVGAILGMFSKSEKQARQLYKAFVEGAMGKEPENPLKKVYGGVILGGEGFIKKVLSQLERDRIEKIEVSHRQALHATLRVEQIIEAIRRHYRMSLDVIGGNKSSEARNACIYLLKRHTGASNVEIGEIFGKLTYSAIAKISQSFSKRMEHDEELRKRVESIQSECLGGTRI